VLTLYAVVFVCKLSRLFTIKYIDENTYQHKRRKISDFLMVILLVYPYNVVTRYVTIVCIRASGTKKMQVWPHHCAWYDKTAKMMTETLPTQHNRHLH